MQLIYLFIFVWTLDYLLILRSLVSFIFTFYFSLIKKSKNNVNASFLYWINYVYINKLNLIFLIQTLCLYECMYSFIFMFFNIEAILISSNFHACACIFARWLSLSFSLSLLRICLTKIIFIEFSFLGNNIIIIVISIKERNS